MRTLVVIAAFAAGVACGVGGAFVCEDDDECGGGSEPGMCQSTGYCSFPDDECPSGQRYGEHVAGELAGACVPSEEDTGGSAGEAMTTSNDDDDTLVDDGVSSLDTSSSGSEPGSSTGSVGLDDSTGGGDESTGDPVELDPDLVLWLTFDDPQATLADASMYARDVSCDVAMDACPAVVTDGAMDLAAVFDGADDSLQVLHDPALETDTGLTVAVRVRDDALSDLLIHTVIARPYGILTENSWELFFRDQDGDGTNNVVFEIADPTGQVQLIAPLPAAKGEWARIVAVWTVDSIAIYYDGVLSGSVASTGMLFDESPIVVGGDIDNEMPRNWFIGAIDDVRVYRRVLSEAEIAALD